MHIGLDIGKTSIDFAIPTKNGGWRTGRFSNNEKGFELFLRRDIAKLDNPHLVSEATGIYYFPVFEFFMGCNIPFSVVNPTQIKNFKRTILAKHKTDKADAIDIAEYGRIMNPPESSLRSAFCIELQRLINLRNMLLKNKRSLANMRESITFYSVSGVQAPLKALEDIEEVHEEKMKKLEKTIHLFAETHFENYKLLRTIPGMGPVASAAFIAYTDDFRKFKNIKQLTAYCGIAPRHYESGTTVYKNSRIAPKGLCHTQLRTALIQAAGTAIRYNQEVKNTFDRLPHNSKEKNYKKRLVAAANKLLRQIWAVVHNNVPYEEIKT